MSGWGVAPGGHELRGTARWLAVGSTNDDQTLGVLSFRCNKTSKDLSFSAPNSQSERVLPATSQDLRTREPCFLFGREVKVHHRGRVGFPISEDSPVNVSSVPGATSSLGAAACHHCGQTPVPAVPTASGPQPSLRLHLREKLPVTAPPGYTKVTPRKGFAQHEIHTSPRLSFHVGGVRLH